MRYIDRDEVAAALAERGLTARRWAILAGFKPHQVFTVLNGTASPDLSKQVASKMHADRLIAEMPEIRPGARNTPEKPQAQFWTVQQVAAFLSLSDDAVRIWMKNGKYDFPKPVRIGGCTRIDRSELERWIEKRKETR